MISGLGARGHNKVCDSCESRAVDSTGRPVEISETLVDRDGVMYFSGPHVLYRKPDPQAGEVCEEADKNFRCWVDGIECEVYEGAAGWLGLIVR